MTRPDPASLGTSGYARFDNDHYVTPERTVKSLLSVIEDDLPSFAVWEAFCGNGAFTKLLEPTALNIVSTDLQEYPGFTPDALVDFFDIKTKAKAELLRKSDPDLQVKTLDDIAALKGFTPDVIISNPPYNMAEECLRHSLDLMAEVNGDVIFLLRNEFDSGKRRRDLFRDHPAFYRKITLLHRPRWIEGSTGAPRHNYSFFWHSFYKANTAPKAKAELLYAE